MYNAWSSCDEKRKPCGSFEPLKCNFTLEFRKLCTSLNTRRKRSLTAFKMYKKLLIIDMHPRYYWLHCILSNGFPPHMIKNDTSLTKHKRSTLRHEKSGKRNYVGKIVFKYFGQKHIKYQGPHLISLKILTSNPVSRDHHHLYGNVICVICNCHH